MTPLFALLIGPILLMLPDPIWNQIFGLKRFIPVRRRPAEDLQAFLSELKRESSLRAKVDLPQYKFYTALLVQILDYARRFGTPLQPLIKEIRSLLIEDQKFEKTMKSEMLGALSQFIMVSLITWGFVVSTYLLVEIAASSLILLIICSLQVLGLLLYCQIFRKWKRIRFVPYEKYYCSILTFKALTQVGLPVGRALTDSNIGSALEGPLLDINQRLTGAICRWKGEGIPIRDEINESVDELSFLLKESYGRFRSQCSLLKFAILALFFLPSYLIYIFSIFNSFFS